MMTQIDADEKHPKPDDGKIMQLEAEAPPLVRVTEIYGRAIKYTRTYGLVEWVDEGRYFHVQCFPAGQIKRVDKETWRGRPL
ncbi:hypothetical protein NEK97_02470 [Paenarthrobacter sp. UW852]|uniref:hypothetical protein n=1 Tax=Paenarthrobacter sp. UW852 TaxID=2951989 RepID=UPI0021488ED4|nr:hypothetical protein [Paenarthrobacter sp. UW852]MCR1160325.1 hypothetical protein [Paenarthrobacter sp. UW852]